VDIGAWEITDHDKGRLQSATGREIETKNLAIKGQAQGWKNELVN
jgi:hypothetical protein